MQFPPRFGNIYIANSQKKVEAKKAELDLAKIPYKEVRGPHGRPDRPSMSKSSYSEAIAPKIYYKLFTDENGTTDLTKFRVSGNGVIGPKDKPIYLID